MHKKNIVLSHYSSREYQLGHETLICNNSIIMDETL